MPGAASISGVISGLKTDEIIAKLIELERMPITRLQAKKASFDQKLLAWQEANTRILALKTKADAMAFSLGFSAKSFSSSDETVVRGSATTSAQAGVYYITVNALARADQQKSIGFADTTNTRVGTGSISLTVGSGTATVIDIDDSNNTLTGLRDAINRSGAGVVASIVNDGSATEPYRLIVTSKTSGIAGSVTIDTANLTGGTAPGFTTLQAAQDASITLGEGAGALTVTRGTNEITGLIPGVTLNLQSASPTQTVAINIQSDNTAVKQNIKDFVDQYNNLVDFINQQFKYNTTTNSGGTLFGDFQLQMIQSDIVSKMFSPVSGLSDSIVMLSQIGITSATDNKLTVNETELDAALSEDLDAVTRLFAASAVATDAAVSYVSSTRNTVVSGTGAYAVEVTAAATQMMLTAGAAQSGNLVQDETLTINGVTVQLTQNMTQAEVVAEINERSSQTNVIASIAGGNLTLTNVNYGSSRPIVAASNISSGGSGLGSPQSRVTAGAAQSQALAQNEQLTINGISVQLTTGMTAAQVVRKINDYTSQTGVVAARTGADGQGTGSYLTLTSALPGSGQSVSVVSTVSNGGGSPVVNTSGIGNVQVTQSSAAGETGTGTGATGSGSGALGADVAGTINGEVCTGSGQVLTGSSGNATTDGLQLRITASAPGSYGTVSFTKGLASNLSDYLDFITAAGTGSVKTAQDTITTTMKDVTDYIAVLEERVTAKQDRLVRQFAAMERALSRLQGQGNYLASQLASFTKKE